MPKSSLPPPPPPPPRPGPPPSANLGISDHRLTYDHSVTWGMGDAWASLGVFLAVSLIVGLIAFGLSDDGSGAGLAGPALPLSVGIPPVCLGIYVWYIARRKGRGLGVDFAFITKPSDAGLGAVLTISGWIASGVVAVFMVEVLNWNPSATVAELAEESTGEDGGLTIWIIALAVLAVTVVPVVEELLFRGLWWSALEKRGMSSGWIVVTTSFVFAAFHLEPTRTPIVFVLGLALGAGRLATGRLGPCIFAHAMINSIAMTFLLIELSKPGTLS